MTAWVYTQAGCPACDEAKQLVAARGYAPVEVPIDNPLVELGVKLLFRDGLVHAPVVVLPDGFYVLTVSEPRQLLRIVDLTPLGVAVPALAGG